MVNGDHNIYPGGRGAPTLPDIQAIRTKYPDHLLEEGQIIDYEMISEIIGVPKNSHRFRSVTDRWRKLVEYETGRVLIGTEPGVGFKVLSNKAKLETGCTKQRIGLRFLQRANVIGHLIDPKKLSEDDRERHAQMQRRTGAIMAIEQYKSTQSLPTIVDAL